MKGLRATFPDIFWVCFYKYLRLPRVSAPGSYLLELSLPRRKWELKVYLCGEEGPVGPFPPFSEGFFQASQLPDFPGPQHRAGGGIVAPFVGHGLPLRAPKSTNPGGMNGKGRGGSVPGPLPPTLGLQAHRTAEGKVFSGAWTR